MDKELWCNICEDRTVCFFDNLENEWICDMCHEYID